MEKIHVITICGSRKFTKQIDALKREFERKHHIVLIPNWNFTVDEMETSVDIERYHASFDKKILMSDVLYVMDYNGYYGDNTKREIKFALEHNIDVKFTSKVFGTDVIDIYMNNMENSIDLSGIPSNVLIEEMENRVANDEIMISVDVNFSELKKL